MMLNFLLTSSIVIVGQTLVISASDVKLKSLEPLYLTHYITSGRIEEGRKEAEVNPFLEGIKSYSGYFTVHERYNSNLFFWYFPCKSKNSSNSEAPLVIWLQGGPGASSLFGLFTENGPYEFKKGKLGYRKYAWTNDFNVLYIDNPVGTGFSFTDDDEHGYATNQATIGENLHEALRQFLILFPNLQKSGIIISGESYAGKYIPSLAYTILNKPNTNPSINIAGLLIGNPMISPEHMLHYNEYLYSHGLVDANGQQELKKQEDKMRNKIRAGKWKEASELMSSTFFGMDDSNTLFYKLTGLQQYFNLLKEKTASTEFITFLNQPHIRKALHVGYRRFSESTLKVFNRLQEDIMKSMKPIFETVLENYPTLVFTGQLDIICPWYLQENLLLHLSWSGAWEYYTAERKPFHLNQYLVGYYKTAKKFTDMMIRNAGHMVPTDKPRWALDLLQKFSKGYFLK
ncbi:venom serine carboxypeptidase-like [Planococcus citri]|uniref:venom serine carboxypeptidase-like n=1 Tax=Planococcus citri TaxID=170843 RepID=UPI0031F7B51A